MSEALYNRLTAIVQASEGRYGKASVDDMPTHIEAACREFNVVPEYGIDETCDRDGTPTFEVFVCALESVLYSGVFYSKGAAMAWLERFQNISEV